MKDTRHKSPGQTLLVSQVRCLAPMDGPGRLGLVPFWESVPSSSPPRALDSRPEVMLLLLTLALLGSTSSLPRSESGWVCPSPVHLPGGHPCLPLSRRPRDFPQPLSQTKSSPRATLSAFGMGPTVSGRD
jgi:hypothetical protein